METTTKLSFTGLNAANFFQAEMVGVILPVLNVFLKNAGWRYDALGLAAAVAGLGGVLFQGVAGWLTDRVSNRRLLFAVASLLTGCFMALIMPPALFLAVSILVVGS